MLQRHHKSSNKASLTKETYQISFLNVTSHRRHPWRRKNLLLTFATGKYTTCFIIFSSIRRGALKQVTSWDLLVSKFDESFQTENMIRFNCMQPSSRKSSRSKKVQGEKVFLDVVNKSSVSQAIHLNYEANAEIHKVVLWKIFVFSHEKIAVTKPHRSKISWSHNLGLQHRVATSWNVCFAYMHSWEKLFYFYRRNVPRHKS